MKGAASTNSHIGEAQTLLDSYLRSIASLRRQPGVDWWKLRASDAALLEARTRSREFQACFVELALREARRLLSLAGREECVTTWDMSDPQYDRRADAVSAAAVLLKRRLPFTMTQLEVLLDAHLRGLVGVRNRQVLEQVRHALGDRRPTGAVLKLLKRLSKDMAVFYREDAVKLSTQLADILKPPPKGAHRNVKRPTKRVTADTLDELLRHEVQRAAERLHVRRPFVPSCEFPSLEEFALPEEARVVLLWRAAHAAPTTHGSPECMHPAQFFSECTGYASVHAAAPSMVSLCRSLLRSVSHLPDAQLFELFFWPRSSQRGRPWHADSSEKSAWRLHECLFLAGLARPEFIRLCRERVTQQNDGWDSPWWGRHLEPVEDDARRPYEFVIRPGDAWANAAMAHVRGAGPAQRRAWLALLTHCDGREWNTPPKRWLAQAEPLVSSLDARDHDSFCGWLGLIGARGDRSPNLYGWPHDPTILRYGNSRLLRSLMFAMSLRPSSSLAAALADAAIAADRTALHVGPRCAIVRNAAIAALSTMPPQVGGGQLARLDQLLKYKTSKRLGGAAISRAASAAGIDRDEFLEVTASAFEFSGDGSRHFTFGEVAARMRIEGARTATSWSVRGEPVESETRVKSQSKGVTSVRKFSREVDNLLAAHRLRIERLLSAEREWTLKDFRDRYLEHPLLGSMSGRLIWTILDRGESRSAIYHRSRWITSDGGPLQVEASASIRPWHPAASGAREVLMWRKLLEQLEVRQPFKQAHREVYLLTAAERSTSTFSNRFAGHLLRGPQLVRLLRERGWEGNPAVTFDSASGNPTLQMPRHDLRVIWRIDSTDHEDGAMIETLSSDRVTFTRPDSDGPLALRTVPPLVFSEVMRDIDLFVSVCSIGADPHWQDGGRRTPPGQYWWDFNFGSIAEAGATRRDVLTRLLPRLAIASRCSLTDKYLVVQGNRRTYKIHLGSGNILMEPNDQYLCIVPGRGEVADRSDVFLPFEGDRTLSIILSKAFMLAEDDKIKDPSILSQIRRGSS